MNSQTQRVLAHLRTAPITSLQAIHWMGCLRLGARIYDLRRNGHVIAAEFKQVKNRRGEVCRVK